MTMTMTMPAPPPLSDMELQGHLADLSSLAEQRSRLQEEGERMDGHLLLLNTVLWMKKLQSYAHGRHAQPLTVALHCPFGPSASPLSLPLSLSLTNCTPITLCTPSPACTLLASFDIQHLPSSACRVATHSAPPPRPLLPSSSSFSLSLSLSLPWPAAECTVDCSVSFLYQLPCASSSTSSSPSFLRSFSLQVGRVQLSGADISQATRVAAAAAAPTLHDTVRAVLPRTSSDTAEAAAYLPPPLSDLFSPIPVQLPTSASPTSAVSFSIALLSALLAFDSRTASTTSMSAFSSALFHHLLANPLHPPSPSKALTPTTLRWCSSPPSHTFDIRLELRHIDSSPSPPLTLPFLHLHSSSSTLLPAAHRHLAGRLAEVVSGRGGRQRTGEGAWERYGKLMEGMAMEGKGGKGVVGDGVAGGVAVSSQWVTLLFDAHLLPRSVRHADQLSQVRHAQRELAVLACAVRADGAGLSPAQLSLLWQRCCRRLSALYVQSRRTGAADSSSLEGALLGM